jgi:hypothetical protein
MSTMKREPCIRCGVLIATDHAVSLSTVMKLSRLPVDRVVDCIVEVEGLSRELAQEFVDHKMGHRCRAVEPPCPNCAAPLKTWHATGCRACGWRRDPARHLTNDIDRST